MTDFERAQHDFENRMPEERIPMYSCWNCREDIFESDEYYRICGEPYCIDCVEDCMLTAEKEQNHVC